MPSTTKSSGKSGRPKKQFHPQQKIEVVVEENPRRPGSTGHKSFKKYQKCKTVGEYLAKRGPDAHTGHLRWDLKHGYIKLH